MARFDYRKTFIIGFGFLGISIIWPIFNRFIPIFLQSAPDAAVRGFGLTPTLAFFIMTWDNLINIFVQPWVGERSDRTWNRFGRRKGWILLGAPVAIVGFLLVPLAQSVLAIAVFILITNFGMALFRSPTVAWLGDLFAPEVRSKANGIINLMGGIGFAVALFGGGYLFTAFGRTAPFIGGAILLLAAVSVALKFVREPQQIVVEREPQGAGVLANLRTILRAPDRSALFVLLGILFWFTAYEALDTGLSSFAVFTLGIEAGLAAQITAVAGVAFILSAVPAGLAGTRFGRRQSILAGLTGLLVVFLGGYFFIQNVATFIVALVLVGIAWAFVNVNSLPLVYDHGDERKIGAYTGLYYFCSQSAAVLGPVLGGALVDLLGDEFRYLFLFSTVFIGLAWLAMTRVRAGVGRVIAPA